MMRFIYIPLIGAVLSCISSLGAAASNIEYSIVRWNDIPVHVVTVNLDSPVVKVTAAIARDGTGSSEPFSSMVGRLRPAAAITGTFFCTQSLYPTGDIVIAGERVHTGSVGTGVCFTAENRVAFVPLKEGRRTGWEGYDTVVCAGPTLIRNGSWALSPGHEGFNDPGIFAKKRRAALGVTAHNKLLLVTVNSPIYLRTLAKIMLHLGSINAVDMDGGTSAALYCGGKVITHPGRKLTNLLVVYDSLTEYYVQRHALAPMLRTPAAADAVAVNVIPGIFPTPSSHDLYDGSIIPAGVYTRDRVLGTTSYITDGR